MTGPDPTGDGARWTRVGDLFAAALERPASERASFLEERCAGDAQLLAEVLELLAVHEAPGPLDGADFDTADGTPSPWEYAPAGGTRIGTYEILRELGRGGMGSVHLARRADGQFELDVALKLHSAHVGSTVARERFLAERRILARLAHPNIARLLDGGVTDEGRPFLVMEYVDGLPIDEYCDRHRLSIDQRLELFTTVCAAVQFAHQRLVVHRDIKPRNILVTRDGSPRLLDFGIAKLVDPEVMDAATELTRAGARMLTPAYASPEQAWEEPIGTPSDVYQLGLLLFELLTGTSHAGREHTSLAELRQSLRTGETTAPSACFAATSSRPTPRVTGAIERAAARASSPERLCRRLSGDLDTIVLRALRPEPDRRYSSAGQFAEDVRRHLDGRPVLARPDALLYRTGKFVRRNPVPLAIATALVLAVSGFGTGIARQARRIALERDRATEVTRFLVGLFDSADPYRLGGDTLTVREALRRGAVRVRQELAEQPLIRATVMHSIADIYRRLGLRREALPLQEEAVALRRHGLAEDHPDRVAAVLSLAILRSDLGDFAAAAVLLEEAEPALRRTAGPRSVALARGLNSLGYAWQVQGQWDRAEWLQEEALGVFRMQPTPDDSMAVTLNNLGWLRLARDDLDSAEVFLRAALEFRVGRLGPDHPSVANSHSALATLQRRQGSFEEAEASLAEALRIWRPALPPHHPTLAFVKREQAGILRGKGDIAGAETLLREAIAGVRSSLGNEHFALAELRTALGDLLAETGRLTEAEALQRRAVASYRSHFGAGHANTASAERNLARVLSRLNRPAEADSLYAHAVAILEHEQPGAARTAVAMVDFGIARMQAGNVAGAEAVLRRALDILRAAVAADDDRLHRARNALGSGLGLLGRYAEAEALLGETLALTRGRPANDPYRAFAAAALAHMNQARGRY